MFEIGKGGKPETRNFFLGLMHPWALEQVCKFLVAGCPSLHQQARIREEALDPSQKEMMFEIFSESR